MNERRPIERAIKLLSNTEQGLKTLIADNSQGRIVRVERLPLQPIGGVQAFAARLVYLDEDV